MMTDNWDTAENIGLDLTMHMRTPDDVDLAVLGVEPFVLLRLGLEEGDINMNIETGGGIPTGPLSASYVAQTLRLAADTIDAALTARSEDDDSAG